MKKREKKWQKFDDVLNNMRSRECAVSIREGGLLFLHGEVFSPGYLDNDVFCRMAATVQIADDTQIPVAFCKL